jgi:hypothetical protein
MKPIPIQYALLFFGACILIYAIASKVRMPASLAPDPYIYSTYQGIGVRTHKVTGVMEFGGPEGWRSSLRAKTRSYNH